MDEKRLIKRLVALHDGLPRQWPGDSAPIAETALITRYAADCGYVFYILRCRD